MTNFELRLTFRSKKTRHQNSFRERFALIITRLDQEVYFKLARATLVLKETGAKVFACSIVLPDLVT